MENRFDAEALVALGRALMELDYRFTTVTPATQEIVNSRPESQYARDLRGVFGWSRPFEENLLPASLLKLMEKAGILHSDGGLLRSRLRASTMQGLLFFHSAWPTVQTDAVFFGPDTHRFADAILRELAGPGKAPERAVDIGCGTGAAAILIARACPQAQVLASDINPAALALAEVNARLAGASNVTTVKSDLLQAFTGEFDLIVANPPYLLDPGARSYRHGGGQHGEGLSLAIVEQACPRLTAGGTLLLYTGVAIVEGQDAFLAGVRRMLPPAVQWDYAELDPDVFGEELSLPHYEDVERIAAILLTCRAQA